MDSLVIRGGRPLRGDINISGAKNAALPVMASGLLVDKLRVTNVPKLTDIYTMIHLLQNHGGDVEVVERVDQLELTINYSKINNLVAPYDIVRKMRASIWVLGPLLARYGQAKVSLPGGCAIGARQVDLHIAVLRAMGAVIEIEHGYINATTKGQLRGVDFTFDKISVGATINAVMAASLARGTSTLFNCAEEPEVVDLCNCLKMMGSKIEGVGSSVLKITGKSSLMAVEYEIIPDRIEAGTYMIAAAISRGDLNILGISPHAVEHLTHKLVEVGVKVSAHENWLRVAYDGVLKAVNVETGPYPGFATDLQAQFMSLMTLSTGIAVITENIFENRFMHATELCRMGADIAVQGNSAVVRGTHGLNGAEVMASDLRASVSLILAALSSKDETKVNRIYHLDRGYQMLEQKLNNCGADITRVKS